MSETLNLKALYYPYARCTNENTLKRAILIFDEIGFVDPTSPEMRERLITDQREIPKSVIRDWETIRDAYGPLLERNIVKLHDPEPVVRNHDKLLAAALKADLNDNEVWKICTAPGTPPTWSILRRRVPLSAFEFLNSQTYGRINYGTARAKAFFHREFMDWPNLEGKIPLHATSPFDPDELGDMESWYRYLFHDGKVAREMDSRYIGNETERQDYLKSIEFSRVFPYTHGSSLNVNTALLLLPFA